MLGVGQDNEPKCFCASPPPPPCSLSWLCDCDVSVAAPYSPSADPDETGLMDKYWESYNKTQTVRYESETLLLSHHISRSSSENTVYSYYSQRYEWTTDHRLITVHDQQLLSLRDYSYTQMSHDRIKHSLKYSTETKSCCTITHTGGLLLKCRNFK